MKTIVILSLAAVLAAGCSSSPPPSVGFPAPSGPIADSDLGLSKGSVFDVPTPPAVKTNESNPGEAPLLPRPYVIAPPRVPHAVADFLPITQKQNACLDCHAVKEKKQGDPTPIPPSHYTDYRNADASAPERGRHVCVLPRPRHAPNLMRNYLRPERTSSSATAKLELVGQACAPD
jgi:cytochrome c-type protein NapB